MREALLVVCAGCSASNVTVPADQSLVADLANAADLSLPPGSDLAVGPDLAIARDLAGCGFDDDFSGSQLSSCWQVLSTSNALIDIAVTGGALHLQAKTGVDGVWYQGSTKSLVYKPVSGDFVVTSTAHPRKRSDGTATPTHALHVGGLMARSPASMGGATESYVLLMVGANESAQPGVEVKSTVNGASTWNEPVWATPDVAQLRICRLGTNLYTYKRASASVAWTPVNDSGQAAPIARPDLPATLQVGMGLNFSGPDADLDVAFDDITLTTPSSVADCTN